jgi:hypothetical protein
VGSTTGLFAGVSSGCVRLGEVRSAKGVTPFVTRSLPEPSAKSEADRFSRGINLHAGLLFPPTFSPSRVKPRAGRCLPHSACKYGRASHSNWTEQLGAGHFRHTETEVPTCAWRQPRRRDGEVAGGRSTCLSNGPAEANRRRYGLTGRSLDGSGLGLLHCRRQARYQGTTARGTSGLGREPRSYSWPGQLLKRVIMEAVVARQSNRLPSCRYRCAVRGTGAGNRRGEHDGA